MNAAASWMLWELARTTLLVAVLGVSAWLVLRLARIGSPALHRACCVAVLLAGWTFVRWPVEVAWYEAPAAPVTEQIVAPVEAPQSFSPPIDPALLSPPPEFGAPMSLPQQMSTEPPPAESPPSDAPTRVVPTPAAALPANWQLTWQLLAIGGWLVGMVAIAAAWLVGYLRFLQTLPGDVGPDVGPVAEWSAEFAAVRAEQGGAGDVTLRVTESAGPLLCRIPRRAMLLVPRSMWMVLAPHERRAILRHELAHYRRGDLWKSLAVRVLALPHWFNPIAWLAVRRFDEAAEWACDRAAMGEEPTTYAAMLLRLGELASTPARFGSAMSNRPLTNRIRRLLTLDTSEDSAMKKATLLSLLLLVAPLAILRVSLVAKQPEAAASLVSDRQESGETATRAPKPTENPQVAETSVQAAKRRVVVEARNAFLAHNVAYDEGTVILESLLAWSNRWLAAELEVAITREEQLAAARKHLERMKKRRAAINKLNDIGARGGEAILLQTVDYFVADVERRLAEIEAGSVEVSLLRQPAAALAEAPSPTYATPPFQVEGKFYELDDPALVPALRKIFSDPDNRELPAALDLVIMRLKGLDGKVVSGPGKQLAREVIRLLDHPQKSIRDTAAKTLLSMRSQIESELKAAADSNNPEIAEKARALLSQAEPIPSRPSSALRYDGKTFDQWVAELQTDLSPTLRQEAMQALGEFAGHGYGNRVAEAIFETMQGYSIWTIGDTPEGRLKDAAISAALKVPDSERLPAVIAGLKSANANARLFALRVIPEDDANEQIIALLVAAMQDADSKVARKARMNLAYRDHDNPALVNLLRRELTSGQFADIEHALSYVRGQVRIGLHSGPVRPYLQLVPEAVALLDHPDEKVRIMARQSLASIGTPLLEPLREILSSGKASDALRQLYEEIEAKSPPFGDTPARQ